MSAEREGLSCHTHKTWIFLRLLALLSPLLLADNPVSSAWGQMPVEREVRPEEKPFILKGSLSPASPGVGEVVEITAEITSRVFPHIRTVVRFFVDGQKREETAYVIAPAAESFVTHEWQAVKGKHTVRIEVVSPAGILYESWEKQVTIR